MTAGNEISVTVNNGAAVGVDVAAATGDALYVTNGSTAAVTVTSVGDRGPQGDPGPSATLSIGTVSTGSTAAATITGVSPNQTLNLVLPRGEAGANGSQVEIQAGATHIQWRYVGGSSWTNLVALSAITGPQGIQGIQGVQGAPGSSGTNGREVQVQANSTHIQWRYAGDTTWTNLVALSAITGPAGSGGLTIGALIALT